jgi:hypothetical protein
MNARLQVGDVLRCPRCRKWHPVVKCHTSGTDYTLRMLYFRCKGQRFYAGQEGLESRHETAHSMNALNRREQLGKGGLHTDTSK